MQQKEQKPLRGPGPHPLYKKVRTIEKVVTGALTGILYFFSRKYLQSTSPAITLTGSFVTSFGLTKLVSAIIVPRVLPRFMKLDLEPYSPQWAIDFTTEKKRLEDALKPEFGHLFSEPEGIRHIGSTSLVNIKLSTSMIDMALKVSCDDLPKEFYEKMKELGYFTRGPSPHVPTGEDKWFHTGKKEAPPGHGTGFNIHIVCNGAHEWADSVIGFTEYCNKFEHEKKVYEDAKQGIIDAGIKDMGRYKKMKLTAVLEIRERADKWRKEQNKNA